MAFRAAAPSKLDLGSLSEARDILGPRPGCVEVVPSHIGVSSIEHATPAACKAAWKGVGNLEALCMACQALQDWGAGIGRVPRRKVLHGQTRLSSSCGGVPAIVCWLRMYASLFCLLLHSAAACMICFLAMNVRLLSCT